MGGLQLLIVFPKEMNGCMYVLEQNFDDWEVDIWSTSVEARI